MKKKLTIQDIADMAGVSKAAVSRYMNDGSQTIIKSGIK